MPVRNFRRFTSQPAPESKVVPDSTTKEQFLPESIEICYPVCRSINFGQDEAGQTSCEECDYVEVIEVLIFLKVKDDRLGDCVGI